MEGGIGVLTFVAPGPPSNFPITLSSAARQSPKELATRSFNRAPAGLLGFAIAFSFETCSAGLSVGFIGSRYKAPAKLA